MQFIFLKFLLIEIYILIKVTSNKGINTFRKLPESDPNSNSSSCFSFSDCFNCTLNKNCRWYWTNESCVPFEHFDHNYSLPILSKSESNLTIINDHINFIRKACFNPHAPYIKNNKSIFYNNISVKYCGPHFIATTEDNIKSDLKIEMKNIKGTFGIPNILCEYIILSGPSSFDIRIEINKPETNNFYLLYSEDSINFTRHINSSRSLSLKMKSNYVHTFVFYTKKTFYSPPFTISYIESKEKKKSQITGYIMLSLIIILFIIIVFGIIYIRRHSKLFISTKTNASEEGEKINDKKNDQMKTIEKITVGPISPGIIGRYNPQTPDTFLVEKKFVFNNICCVDKSIIVEENDIYKAKCGHLYHMECFNQLVEDLKNSKEKQDLKCVSCNEVIYSI